MSKVMQPEMVEPRYKPRQAVCPEPRSHQDPNHLSSLSSWPRAMCAGIWRALVGTCLALVYLGVLRHRHLAGHRSWASTLHKVLTHTLAHGVFPIRISLHSIFCPKALWKRIWFQGKTAVWAQAGWAWECTQATVLSCCCYILDGTLDLG